MKSVVTGGSGFLGSTIAQLLLEQGHEVVVVDLLPPGSKGLHVDCRFVQGDVRNRELLAELFDGADEVFHLAGVLGTAELQESQELAIDVNIKGTVAVFETAVEHGVPRVFYPGKPNVWLNTYSITKYAAEQFARMSNLEHPDTKICSLRYYNAYGPGQALHPIRKIVPAFAAQAMRGLPLEVFGDGEQIVDMIYSRDLADLTIKFTRQCITDVVPDCGSGVGKTVNEVAALVNEHFGNNAGIKYLPMRSGETPRAVLTANLTELTTNFGLYDHSNYEESMKTTLEWYTDLSPSVLDEAARFYSWESARRPE
ncbi:nucleoside-diphosphate-sugar epimerase [Saccharothrix ecbatanensis]|uniref:Nucleoside-diphosphate-sugar epimerase n=1 Tax=Saccharothrix ecbatanensis TaxID=1105145 RepID=A0A7W9LY23_9PSEU|nr:NAD-dependent epimerase/dehydratase family protein [Saccharothrix ecbatanensis]MBB5800263.1 nucleoside-diphosphate-sugar epimerase [Saccharothrix ecbatanensis]